MLQLYSGSQLNDLFLITVRSQLDRLEITQWRWQTEVTISIMLYVTALLIWINWHKMLSALKENDSQRMLIYYFDHVCFEIIESNLTWVHWFVWSWPKLIDAKNCRSISRIASYSLCMCSQSSLLFYQALLSSWLFHGVEGKHDVHAKHTNTCRLDWNEDKQKN